MLIVILFFFNNVVCIYIKWLLFVVFIGMLICINLFLVFFVVIFEDFVLKINICFVFLILFIMLLSCFKFNRLMVLFIMFVMEVCNFCVIVKVLFDVKILVFNIILFWFFFVVNLMDNFNLKLLNFLNLMV